MPYIISELWFDWLVNDGFAHQVMVYKELRPGFFFRVGILMKLYWKFCCTPSVLRHMCMGRLSAQIHALP